MKKILSLILLLCSINCFPQKKKQIDSFLDVKFGATFDDVTKQLEAKGGVPENKDDKVHTDLLYKGLSFNALKPVYQFVKFYQDKLYEGGFMFKQATGIPVLQLNEQVITELTKMYGPPQQTLKKFSDPYQEGDGKASEAVDSGHGSYNTYWFDDASNFISVDAHQGEVIVIIGNGKMHALAVAQQEQKAKAEL